MIDDKSLIDMGAAIQSALREMRSMLNNTLALTPTDGTASVATADDTAWI
jgi:hypothetical protein